jgi:hypothetical protein
MEIERKTKRKRQKETNMKFRRRLEEDRRKRQKISRDEFENAFLKSNLRELTC